MPKPAAGPIKHDLTLDHTSSLPLYRQLYERLRSAILSGQLHPGARLPSTRTLASQLGISRNVVCLSCDQLLAEGYIESKVGHGMRVAATIPEHLLTVPAALHTPHPPVRRIAPPAVDNRGSARAFRAGVPALDAFPFASWARIVARHARKTLPAYAGYQDPLGYRPLREAIAAHIGVARGVRCAADQVLIVAGAQSGLDLVARLLLAPGDQAWLENPGYHGARAALQAAGARIVPVPVTGEGLDVAAGIARAPQARLALVTPSHQFPLGMTMDLARRLALLDWAHQAQAWILEDDYDSEYRFSGRPLEALQGLDQGQRVLYLGTFSKTLFPALRLGFLVVPAALIDTFAAAVRTMHRHVPILEQLALAEFIERGAFASHLRRMRALYAERRAALIEAVAHELGDQLALLPSEAGLHLVGWLPPGDDDRAAAELAAAYDLDVRPVSLFSVEPLARGGLLLGYAAVNRQDIRSGVRRLARALRSLRRA